MNKYHAILHDVLFLIKDSIKVIEQDIKKNSPGSDNYRLGIKHGLEDVLDLFGNRAESFGILLESIGLDNMGYEIDEEED